IDAGDTVPVFADVFAGLVFMGGPMSVNDDLPWIAPVLSLIREAVADDTPVLGHCLGGQLISKALGGAVTRNPVKEIGWGAVTVVDHAAGRAAFGELCGFDAFHWHGETFSLPPHAVLLLSSAHCAHQAYAVGKHLALQCHVEMTDAMVAEWCEIGADEIAANLASPAVQQAADMQQQAAAKLPQLHRVAEQLYTRWIAGLKPR
ncbi:MAG: type 1 glutamine amidotransferase, partial [Gallionella sp.]|nr:type 1 glutamine amidotransferase [Gallionella sp.]